MEYCSPVWSPVYKTDIRLLESVQRSFTRKLSGMRLRSYKERLCLLGVESLELRRLKLDLFTIYKIVHGLMDVDSRLLTVREESDTRGGV